MNELTTLAPGERPDEVADPEGSVEGGRLRAVHQVGDPSPAHAKSLTREELGADLRVGDQVVLGVLRYLGADLVVGWKKKRLKFKTINC